MSLTRPSSGECVGEAAAILFRCAANQTRFVLGPRSLGRSAPGDDATPTLQELEACCEKKSSLRGGSMPVQREDSRIGFEATNHYFFTPLDLAEKILNVCDFLDRWLPAERERLTNLR